MCADAPVDNCSGRGSKFACHARNRVGVDADAVGDNGWGKWFDGVGDVAQAAGHCWAAAGINQVFGEQHMQHRAQQQRIAAGANRVPLVGIRCGFGVPRVNDDDLAPAFANGLNASGPIGSSCERTIRFVGVGPKNQQVIGAINIGNCNEDRIAEQKTAGNMLRHLIDG